MTPADEELRMLNLFYKAAELVVAVTHYPKPVAHVAENISIITADDIKAMNAHSVAEVLNRIPGVFLGGYDRNMGSTSHISIQGSSNYHTLVLVDGVRWNFLDGGHAETTNIPVGIIERMEIIKGPASSSWGSSIGGVINIITKSFSPDKPGGVTGCAAMAERNTRDVRGEASHRLGNVGFYLYAGHTASDGLREQRSYENTSVYSKIRIPVKENMTVGFSAGYSKPELSFGSLPEYDQSSFGDFDTFFTTAEVDTHFTDHLHLTFSAYAHKNTFSRKDRVLTGEIWDLNDPGDMLQSLVSENFKWGSNGRLVWKKSHHTALLGVDFERGELKSKTAFAPDYGYDDFSISPDFDSWAIYFNDTIAFHKWAITPGIRYDKNSFSGDFISPSLGVTYSMTNTILLRAIASKGFTSPPLAYTAGGGLYLFPNPDLKPETITSFQAGMETGITDRIWFKTTLFRHDVKDVFFKKWDALGPYMDMWINAGSSTRQGVEVELQALVFDHFSIHPGFSYVHHSPKAEYGEEDQFSFNLILAYKNPEFITVQAMGHYLWWDQDQDDPYNTGSYNDVIWDANLIKHLSFLSIREMDLFITGHNLFNAAVYDDALYKNPGRWLEVGIRMDF